MKTLLILRHAKAENDAPKGDEKRALTKRGEREAADIARQIEAAVGVPDAIVSSDAKRARQTAKIVADSLDYSDKVDTKKSIYAADVDTLLRVVRKLPGSADCVLLVGHNPGFEELADPRWFADMMRNVPRLFRDDLYVLSTTGPQLVSRTLAEFPNAEEHIKVLFPRDVCDRGSWFCFGSYGVHLMEGGWRTQRSLLRRRLMKDWQALMMKRTLKARRQLPEPRALQFGRP